MATADTQFGMLVALAFLPPLAFMLWLRAHEKTDREPFRSVLLAFVYGGTVGVAIALLLHVLFQFGFHQGGTPVPISSTILAAVVIAPIVEEVAKAFGLGLHRKHIGELEDGLVYGAAIGLGFAATENMVYGIAALTEGGFGAAVTTISVRVFSSMLLHASASAIVGFGYALAVLRGGVALQVLPFYLVAVVLHAGYNFLVGLQVWWGFVAALALVLLLTGVVRRRIRELDALPHDSH